MGAQCDVCERECQNGSRDFFASAVDVAFSAPKHLQQRVGADVRARGERGQQRPPARHRALLHAALRSSATQSGAGCFPRFPSASCAGGQRWRCGARERHAWRGTRGTRTGRSVVQRAAVLVCGGAVVECADALKIHSVLGAAAFWSVRVGVGGGRVLLRKVSRFSHRFGAHSLRCWRTSSFLRSFPFFA